MKRAHPITHKGLLAITVLGYAANLILPHIGELSRMYLVKSRADYPAGSALFSIVIERLWDFSTVLVLFGVSILLLDQPTAIFVRAAIFLASAGTTILFGILFTVYRTDTVIAIMRPLTHRLRFGAIRRLRDSLLSARPMLGSMRDPRFLLSIACGSMGIVGRNIDPRHQQAIPLPGVNGCTASPGGHIEQLVIGSIRTGGVQF